MAAKKTKEDLGFEQSLERLEVIVEKLESGELTLDESLKLFKEGVELSKYCSSKLSAVQQEVKKVVVDNKGTFTLESFTGEEE
ncbi:Exodeoxyribonuclease 7 small subunit [bioreactor metagenome]|uniref:Exodeoxyribonuclease 7 small subunit n=1 Tax=bioreactor metagenome TaxID=1076179 RepID=A0A644WH90_9ZZZZ|nr:exodeoxyribonuclease VII small subunit [Acidaminococcaceae bacterium]